MKNNLIGPTSDAMFKNLFGKPSEALRKMINDLLSLDIESVDDIQISNAEQSIESNEQINQLMILISEQIKVL